MFYMFEKHGLENCPKGSHSSIVPSRHVHSLFLGPKGAEVAWLAALRSLPCHMGYSYLARLAGY